MLPDRPAVASAHGVSRWTPWAASLARLAAAWGLLFALTFAQWAEMAHQWWDIDTYGHIVLIPPILAWLTWLRRFELEQIVPQGWRGGLAVIAAGLGVGLLGHEFQINLIAQTGAVVALQGAVLALLGARVALVLAFPLLYALFLVPFGGEIIPPLQQVTAYIAVALTQASGVPAELHHLFIDTPAGRFVVAEECSGVKFLIAMVALAILVGWTGFSRWRRRGLFLGLAVATSVLANGVRAWGTIYVAQYVGAERAGNFDHIIYGWVFFAVVISLVLAAGWRFFDRVPAEGGLTAAEADVIARRMNVTPLAPDRALAAIACGVIGFAVLAQVI
jgi:exosortase A